jgi:histone deacetylase 11
VLRQEGLIRRAAVVDLDVHQGNGTAVIFSGDDDVFTFSMHQAGIYPIPKAKSDLDVELPAGTDDEAYLRELARCLPVVLAKAQPEIVFLQAGCDTLSADPLAHLKMTPHGIVRRDAMVIDACAARDIPVVMTLGGGYSKQAWRAQYGSVKRTILKYGLAGGERPYPRRRPTLKEKLYTK